MHTFRYGNLISFIFIDLNLFHHWNSTEAKFDFNNNETNGSNLSASTQAYNAVTLGQLLPLFMTHFLFYGLLLALIKYFISQNFKSLNYKEKLKQVLKLMIISEVDGDCYKVKWKLEMLLLSLMQIASDLILLVPFFVTGKECFRFQLLLTLISSFLDKL